MQKNWMKTNATYVMTGEGHEKGVKHTYSNVVENASDDQVAEFGKIISELSGDKFQSATLSTSEEFKPATAA